MTEDIVRLEAVLERLLTKGDVPARLRDAMRYAVLGGGKRIRARLVYAAGRLGGACFGVLDRAAAAVEMIHAYSLVHDDLPAMDDDALRRGQPTLHIRYDEATAILVGDALQALAFEVASADAVELRLARRWVRLLANAAGAEGMVGGQVLDMEGETRRLSVAELETMHRTKCCALIRAAVGMGVAAGAFSSTEAEALDAFAAEIGLAFQIHDDVLDVTATTAALGKPQGADVRQGKSTYVGLLGVDGARAEARRRLHLACDHLELFGSRAQTLLEIARFVVERSH